MIVDPHAPLHWLDSLSVEANRTLDYLRSQGPSAVTVGRLVGYTALSNHALESAIGELLRAGLIERDGLRYRVADPVARGDR